MGTDSPTIAIRRFYEVAAAVERAFEEARQKAGADVDQRLVDGLQTRIVKKRKNQIVAESGALSNSTEGPTLHEVYQAYLDDPTRDWSPRTRFAYETTRRVAIAVLGADTPVRSISRAHCRNFIDTLRWLPRNATKRFPKLGPVEAAAFARASDHSDLISVANLNAYLNKLSGVFNWAVKEEFMDRNPAQGLKLPDPSLRRDKRLPFSPSQLQAIFAAPLYTGCRDGAYGYAERGTCRPRNGRFWMPLISLFSGLRLNEACQLDVADIKIMDGVACFIITAASGSSVTDKRLKTASSERVVPIHPELLALGFVEFAAERLRAGETKLFGEVGLGATGYRSATFSAWFARFVDKAGAASQKTCFHSFRHNFRDALREGRVERDMPWH